MKKLAAFLKGKLEDRKIANKVKRVELSLQAAELNFQSAKEDNEIKLEELIEKFNDPEEDVNAVITEISETMDAIDEASEGLTKIQRIKDYLLEDIKG